MKILYASDIHENYETLSKLEEFRKDSKPDLFILSGDILDKGVEFEYFDYLRANMAYYLQLNFKKEDFPYPEQHYRALPDLARFMKDDDKEGTNKTRRLASEYLRALDEIEDHIKEKYKQLSEIVDSEFFMLPGNYDIDIDKVSKKRNLHRKVKNVKGFKIAGYGSANDPWKSEMILPPSIPFELTLPFFELTDNLGNLVKSEPKRFFSKTKPDIAFTHMPPQGLRDLIINPKYIQEMVKQGVLINPGQILQSQGVTSDKRDYYSYLKNEILFNPQGGLLKLEIQKGSPGLREYLEKGFTKLLCCGHVHESVGFEKLSTEKGLVAVFNAGSLNDGYFGEITLNDETKQLDRIILYQIIKEEDKTALILPGQEKSPTSTKLVIKHIDEYVL